MNSSTPGQRRGAHRTRRDITAALVPALLAVLAVAALITAINVWRGQESDDLGASATTGTSSHSAPAQTPSASPSASASNASQASDDESSSAEASDDSTAATEAGQAIDVVVLNQTSRGGLAEVAADRLRERGWTVASVGNFTGVVPATTVYYPPGAEDEAQDAAESLPTPARTRPRFGNLSTTRLTVVVTDNYPG